METLFAVIAVAAVVIVLSGVAAAILAPRQIADDVMADHFGDVPHVE